jgi:16S rRNA (cytidine1402-2'-O)-methyltransferase
MAEHFSPEREASVSRELSKVFEENIRGSLNYLSDYYTQKTPKGEIVIIVAGKRS